MHMKRLKIRLFRGAMPMRRTEYLSEFFHLFDWVLIPDDRGNELVIINV